MLTESIENEIREAAVTIKRMIEGPTHEVIEKFALFNKQFEDSEFQIFRDLMNSVAIEKEKVQTDEVDDDWFDDDDDDDDDWGDDDWGDDDDDDDDDEWFDDDVEFDNDDD